MNRFRFYPGMAVFAILLCAQAASAQTPANISVVTGSGQLICLNCIGSFTPGYQALVVKVTNASGQPLSGVAVSWSQAAGDFNSIQGTLRDTTTYTDNNGLSWTYYTPSNFSVPGGPGHSVSTATIVATVGSLSTTFYLSNGLQWDPSLTGSTLVNPLIYRVLQDSASITPGSSFTGQIGSQSTTPIKIQVVALDNTPISNVAVQLVNTTPNASTMTCATSQSAGPGVVLTDQTGVATCFPVFGGVPGQQGAAYLSVGGAYPLANYTDNAGSLPTSIVQFPNPDVGSLIVNSTPGIPAALKNISGSGQSQQAGRALAAPFVVQAQSSSGAGLAGQTVNWTVSPAGAGQLQSQSTTTDTSGQSSNQLTLSSSALGTVTVTASLAGSSSSANTATFTVTAVPLVTLTGLTIISGSGQSALASSAFAAPLIVQLNSSAGPAAGVPVTFSITGPGALSSNSVTTGSNGQAQVTVQAGSTPGNITVTASASGFSQTFNLVVSPPGPTLTANAFVNAADFQRGSLSPCSLATIIAPGLAPGLQGMVVGSLFGGLPYQVANDTVTVGGLSAPIFSVGLNTATNQQQLTFQVPCEVTPGSSVAVAVNVGAGSATVNVPIQAASPGVFQTTFSDNTVHPVLVRPDGSFVSATNPARAGENLVAFVTGLGQAATPVPTNAVASPNAVVMPKGTVVVGMAGGGVPVVSTLLSDELIGVWMVTFTVPSDITTGNNVTFSVSVIPAGSQTPIASATTNFPVR